MLLRRVMSALIGLIIFFAVMLSPDIVFQIALGIIEVVALKELYYALKANNFKPVEWLGYLSVITIIGINFLKLQYTIDVVLFVVFILLFALFTIVVFSRNKITYLDVSVTVFSVLYIVFLFTFLSKTKGIENLGYLYIWLIFVCAWMTDTSAYFAGSFFGKHKLIPDISPNKTLEGVAGGIIGCILSVLVYGFIIYKIAGVNIGIVHYIVLATIASIFAQIGDLVGSAIKRTTSIKDFGTIMPGHGGVIDRFDSVLLVAPVVYFYLVFVVR